MNWLQKLWRGDYLLSLTFWGFYVVPKAIFSAWLASPQDQPSGPVARFAILSLGVGYLFVAIVGLWRSAGKYQGSKVWKGLAQLAAGIGVLQLAVFVVELIAH